MNQLYKFNTHFILDICIKGGQGGRVVNIASMAGLLSGLGKFDELGYTVSKWGTVSFTR